MLNASSEWKPQGMKQALICCGALLLLACGGGDAGDEDDEGDDGDGQGGDTDAAGDSTDAGSGLEAELDTCIVTVTGDADSGVEPLSYSIPTQGLYQYYLVGDGVFQGTPTANVSCSSAPGVPGPGQESNRAVFSLAFPDELWADIEIPLTGTQAGGPGVATAVLERITDPDPAPVERRNWHCSPVLGDDGTGVVLDHHRYPSQPARAGQPQLSHPGRGISRCLRPYPPRPGRPGRRVGHHRRDLLSQRAPLIHDGRGDR